MKIIAVDWAIRKETTVYDGQDDKIKNISSSIDSFQKYLNNFNGEKAIFLFEFGGGDSQKIMAYRNGHQVYQIPGKAVKDYREKHNIEKTDENDAKLIYELFVNGNAIENLNNPMVSMLSVDTNGRAKSAVKDSKSKLPANKNSAVNRVNDSIRHLPIFNDKEGEIVQNMQQARTPASPLFYPFKEQNVNIAEIKMIFREHERIKKSIVRNKNHLFAFSKKFELARVSGDRITKIINNKKDSIKSKEKELRHLKYILSKKLEKFDVWNKYLKNIKGIGPLIGAGLIGELGGRHFNSDGGFNHYAGMIPKKESKRFNHDLKMILYQVTEGIIKHKTPQWRELYDEIKVYYAEKHPDWSKGKVNNYTKKLVQKKFLWKFWKQWRMLEC